MIVRISKQARIDLDAQIDWLAERSPRSADDALDAILQKFDLLQDHPFLGMESENGWRETAVDFGRDGYVICYVVRPTDILVIRFFHTRQNQSTPE